MEVEDCQQIVDKLGNRYWRLNNLYHIKNVKGEKTLFKFNWAQEDFYKNIWYFNSILKARQLGFSTFIAIYILDSCLWNDDIKAGIIDATLPDAKKKLEKIKFAYDNLPEFIKKRKPLKKRGAEEIEFENGSGVVVGTSHRGDTLQILHVSEYGKIAARHPDKAIEIKTGALNAVHAGQQIFVESTAEGQQGEFFDLSERARKLKEQGTELTEMDPKFHFYAWHQNPEYVLDADVSVTQEMAEYFDKLGIELSPSQKSWYIKKEESQGEYMKREFPSIPREAFEQSMEGAIYTKQMSLVRTNKRIGYFPHEPSRKVYTFWDLGKGRDYTSIWFFQHIGHEYRFIDYHESFNEGWDFYAKLLAAKPYVYEEHLLPHDGETSTVGKKMSNPKQDLQELGVTPIRIIPRTPDVWNDIKGPCRTFLQRCSFNEDTCDVGIKHLDNYRREWDDRLGVWKDKPRHDEASHACFTGETKVLTRIGTQSIMDLPKYGEVMTLCGWKRYENPRITKKNALVVEAVFAGGHTVKCTQDHLFLTVKGWKSISSLPKNLEILSASTPTSIISAKSFTNFGRVKDILRKAVAGCTEMFGRKLLERFQKDATFIIKMETQKTINFQTLSVWKRLNIFDSHGKKSIVTERSTLTKMPEQRQQNGTGQKKEGSGTGSTHLTQKVTQNGNVCLSLAIIAAKSSLWLCGSLIRKGFAGKYVNLDIVEKIKTLELRHDVWCLTVPDLGHFALENGAIVKNCDAFRTGAMGFRERQIEIMTYYADAPEYVNDYDPLDY